MKTLTSYIAGILTAALLLTAMSCSKNFYSEKNVNPNAPNSLLPNMLLTPIEVSLAYSQGGDMSRFTSMFTQQTTGISGNFAAYEEYIFTNQDPEVLWDNMYTADMENDYQLMQLCSNGTYNTYKGVTEILMAYSLQLMVDCWGPVPYSQAFMGANDLKPAYDNDRTLYTTAASLCYHGINDINKGTNDILFPFSDDVIYSGNTAQWIKFAHAVLARLYIHQSQTGAGNFPMADSALTHVALSFASNADNAQVGFGNAATNNSPNYQFYAQAGEISYISYAFANNHYNSDGFFFGILAATNDPRKFYLVDSVDESYGNNLNSYYQLANSPVEFICYDEIQFIAAEATLRTGGSINAAQGFYRAGIMANMNKVSSNPAIGPAITMSQINTYLNTYGNLSSNMDSALAQIANQEYIALYLNPEAWALWRRSTKIPGFANGSPALMPVAGPYTANGIPRRLLYPLSELNLNGANVPPNTSQWLPRIFWDN